MPTGAQTAGEDAALIKISIGISWLAGIRYVVLSSYCSIIFYNFTNDSLLINKAYFCFKVNIYTHFIFLPWGPGGAECIYILSLP